MVDIYGNANRFFRLKAGLDSWPISAAERALVRDFIETALEPHSPGRRAADLTYLRRIFLSHATTTQIYGKRRRTTKESASLDVPTQGLSGRMWSANVLPGTITRVGAAFRLPA